MLMLMLMPMPDSSRMDVASFVRNTAGVGGRLDWMILRGREGKGREGRGRKRRGWKECPSKP